MEIKYFHESSVHNTHAAERIVPAILKRFKIESVVDVGCGTGTWLSVFEKQGVKEFIGIDGDYVAREKLMISDDHFFAIDLNAPFKLDKKFDLVLCLEVAEHLEERSAQLFIESLTSLGDLVIFSAAIPGQGGQNHLNEQYPDYWVKIFNHLGYELISDFRSEFWNDKVVEWWYRQNIMILKKNAAPFEKIELTFQVHPELYNRKLKEIESLKNSNDNLLHGRVPPKIALKSLIKSLFRSVSL